MERGGRLQGGRLQLRRRLSPFQRAGGFVDHAPVVLTGGASDNDIWSLGALYEWESWKIGANYAHGRARVAVEDAVGGRIERQTGEGWQIAAAYAVTPDIQIAAGFQRYGFEAGAALNPPGLAETRQPICRGAISAISTPTFLFTEFSFRVLGRGASGAPEAASDQRGFAEGGDGGVAQRLRWP